MNEYNMMSYLASKGFTAYRLPTLADIEAAGWISKGDLARVIYPRQSCDTALPQYWVDHAHVHGVDVRPGWVMLYDPTPRKAIIGRPMPLYIEALEELEASEDAPLRYTATQARETLKELADR